MQEHADRLLQMGEEPWRITVSGDPALDLIGQISLRTRDELNRCLEMKLDAPLLLVTYHPETLGDGDSCSAVGELLDDPEFVNALSGHLAGDEISQARVPMVLRTLNSLRGIGRSARRQKKRKRKKQKRS